MRTNTRVEFGLYDVTARGRQQPRLRRSAAVLQPTP